MVIPQARTSVALGGEGEGMSEDLGRGGGAGAGDPASFLQAKGLGPWAFVETEGLHRAAEGCRGV